MPQHFIGIHIFLEIMYTSVFIKIQNLYYISHWLTDLGLSYSNHVSPSTKYTDIERSPQRLKKICIKFICHSTVYMLVIPVEIMYQKYVLYQNVYS